MRSGPLSGSTQMSTHISPLLCFILFLYHCDFDIISPRLERAALTQELLRLCGDSDEPLFVVAYHDIIVISPGALSACVVQ